ADRTVVPSAGPVAHTATPPDSGQCNRESTPQFIFSSATIGNPAELVRLLTGRTPTVIDDDASPAGARHWVFWNPPIIYGRKYRARRSANVEATELMAQLVRRGVPSITFSKAKITAELIYRYVSDNLRETAPQMMGKVMPYRGGYLPEERREIERKLFSGELLGVSCTRALELGIDIGGLDASIVVGYPGTLASFFQQAGRAGRRDRESLVVLVGLDTSINQYVMQNPDYIFGRPIEEVVLDRDNPFIIAGHLRCASHELPVTELEAAEFGSAAPEALRVLQDMRKIRQRAERWYHATAETPQHEISLRGSCEAELIVLDSDTKAVIGHMNLFDGPTYVHPKAIYMHYGDTYFVDELDLIRRIAWVHRVEVDYYTQPHGGTDIHHIDRMLRRKVFGPGTACFGEVTAYFQTNEFERIHFYKLDAFTREAVDPKVPTLQLETMALWFTPDDDVLREVIRRGLDPFSGLRGIGYGLRMLLPLFVTCETLDFSHTVGCTNSPWQSTFIYERYPLGLGFTERAYERLHEILPALLERIKTCNCRDGCPCCVGKPLRGDATWNVERHEGSVPSKKSARLILELMLVDPARLNLPDEDSLGQDEEEARLRLERSLRRRLERHAFPDILHDIAPVPPEGYPEPELPSQGLSDTDVARRAIRRREHDHQRRHEAYKEQQRREAVKAEGRKSPLRPSPLSMEGPDIIRTAVRGVSPLPKNEPNPQPTAGRIISGPSKENGGTNGEPGETAAPAKVLGDAVAAAALKKRRRKNTE
ncbi:MAG: DEAD/DEAH box helicase, partial [Armatimonadota bacterium]